MNPIKIKVTESYKDEDGEHIIARGKLVLLPELKHDKKSNGVWLKAVIISETEPIEVGDYQFTKLHGITKAENLLWSIEEGAKKIIVLPEHFSAKHLQAALYEKIKDGNEVFVKVADVQVENFESDNYPIYERTIWSDLNNHIKLFPIKKEEDWEDVIQDIAEKYKIMIDVRIEEYLEKNYNPPSRKTT